MDLENDIVIDNTGMFFYKFSKDSLIIHVYGLDKSSIDKMKKFKTKLRYWEMENGNADFCDFACEYKKLGFSFFPTSLEYVAQNHAKDCR